MPRGPKGEKRPADVSRRNARRAPAAGAWRMIWPILKFHCTPGLNSERDCKVMLAGKIAKLGPVANF